VKTETTTKPQQECTQGEPEAKTAIESREVWFSVCRAFCIECRQSSEERVTNDEKKIEERLLEARYESSNKT
jgi:hypothetical protein